MRRNTQRMSIEDVKVCNCAECGCILLGESMLECRNLPPGMPPTPSARIKGRPYCGRCMQVKWQPVGNAVELTEDSPAWYENIVRIYEDGLT